MIIHKKAIEQASRDPKVMVRWVGRWRRIQLLSHSSGKDSQFNIQVPPNVVELSSIQIFKRRMNKHLNNQKLWPGEGEMASYSTLESFGYRFPIQYSKEKKCITYHTGPGWNETLVQWSKPFSTNLNNTKEMRLLIMFSR